MPSDLPCWLLASTAARPANDKYGARIADKINQLGHDPDDPGLDVKKLEGEPGWRLRIGGWRVIFDRQDAVRIIAIEKIKPRGDACK